MEPYQPYNPYLNVKLNPPDRDRVPQWSHAETAKLLAIRADLDASFMETKRNKPLWETVSARMHHQGFPRTADQCKSKWKNLLTRFKGSEAMEEEASRQFPFHDDMQRIFSSRMERLLSFEQGKGKEVQVQVEEDSDDDEEEEDSKKKKRRSRKVEGKRGDVNAVRSVLEELMRWQIETEARRLKEWEARDAERRNEEEEWRRTMAAIKEERLAMEARWREREEERRVREEARAERSHALITAILNKLAEKCV